MGGGKGDFENSWEVGRVICKRAFTNNSSHLFERPVGSTSWVSD
jgi:hypothetical protein